MELGLLKNPLKSPPQKVKNILIRHSCSKESLKLDTSFQSPERFHLLKYAPKYYKTLSLEVTKENCLQSKIKRIKKLKNLNCTFKQILPPKLWLNLLSNTRKEIEEIPQINRIQTNIQPSQNFWKELALLQVKFFPNLTKVYLPGKKPQVHPIDEDNYDFTLLIKKSFMRYLRNMRKIKTLQINPSDANDTGEKWMREKLNGMSQCLNRLDKLTLTLRPKNFAIWTVLLKNKNLLSHLTSLTFSSLRNFDKGLVMFIQMCKNLKFLSIDFRWVKDIPEFIEFLIIVQSLPHLLGLKFNHPTGLKSYWTYLKPQASLRSLKLTTDVVDPIRSGFNRKDPVGHWEEIEELDELEFNVSCKNMSEVVFLREFITMVLKKIQKLKSFKCPGYLPFEGLNSSLTGELFIVEEVPHLYESLQKLEYTVGNLSTDEIQFEFDMKQMRVFRNLREFKLDGNGLQPQKNLEELVSFLEENRDLPTLKLSLKLSPSPGWLTEILVRIKEVKRADRNLKIELDLKFIIYGNDLRILDEFCQAIKSVGFIKGLLVRVWFEERGSIPNLSIGEFQAVMSKYSEVRNMVVKFCYLDLCLEYRKIDGEKEQVSKDYDYNYYY